MGNADIMSTVRADYVHIQSYKVTKRHLLKRIGRVATVKKQKKHLKWRYQNDLHNNTTTANTPNNPLPQPSKSRPKENGGGTDQDVGANRMAD